MQFLGKSTDFERAVRGELAVLYRVARRMGVTQEQAEDIVQTTLIKAYQAWHRFDGRHLRSWLIRILRNERLMTLRSERHEPSLDEPTAYEVPDDTVWNELSWKMEADRVLDELKQMPEIYQLVVQLCDVEQLTYQEASEALSVPIGTVRSRLFRARAMLRNRLQPAEGRLEGVCP